MKRSAFVNTSAVFFAAAGGAAGTAPAKTDAKPAAAAVAKPEITVIGVSSAVVMPVNRAGKRGSKNKYDLTALAVGQSLAIKGRKASNLTSTLSTNNRADEFAVFKRDETGAVVFGTKEVTAPDGTKTNVKGDAIVLSRRVFFATDCDPKTDPEGADVRIWRDHDKVTA